MYDYSYYISSRDNNQNYMFLIVFVTIYYNNISYEVMSVNISFIFDSPFICKTVKYIDQSVNSSQCVLGFQYLMICYIFNRSLLCVNDSFGVFNSLVYISVRNISK
jgi:hypothetical protein